jgi:hypothetical protein
MSVTETGRRRDMSARDYNLAKPVPPRRHVSPVPRSSDHDAAGGCLPPSGARGGPDGSRSDASGIGSDAGWAA